MIWRLLDDYAMEDCFLSTPTGLMTFLLLEMAMIKHRRGLICVNTEHKVASALLERSQYTLALDSSGFPTRGSNLMALEMLLYKLRMLAKEISQRPT
jgi:hypothetical protein